VVSLAVKLPSAAAKSASTLQYSGLEGLDLVLALADEAQGHGL